VRARTVIVRNGEDPGKPMAGKIQPWETIKLVCISHGRYRQ